MVFNIGSLDMLQYIAEEGLEWQRSDIDGENAGRTADGTAIRDRICTKIRWDVTCMPLTSTQLAEILTAIEPEFVTVTYTDPQTNSIKTNQFYSNNFPATLKLAKGGVELWTGLAFPLIQK